MTWNETVVAFPVRITGSVKAIKALRQRIGKWRPKGNGKQTKGGSNFENLSAEVLEALRAGLVKMLRKLGLSLDDAMEIAQEAMLAATGKEGITYPRAWLHKVAKNLVSARGRKDQLQEKSLGKRVDLDLAFHTAAPTQELEQAEIQKIVRDAVSRLPADQHLILAYRADGWSNDEIAAAIGCHRNTVRNRLRRAYRRLAEISAIRQCV